MASLGYTMVLDGARLKDRVKSLNSIVNLDGPMILEIMLSLEYNVSMDDPTITKDVEEYVIPSRERDLLHKLKAIVQDPPHGPFLKNDLMWLPHFTSGHGLYREAKITVIP
jgi:hypothetical protein